MAIDGVIWDLDRTIYNPRSGFYPDCDLAAAKAALQLGYDKGQDLAMAVATRSWEEYGVPYELFIKEHKFDRNAMIDKWYENIDSSLITECHNPDFVSQMSKSTKQHAILTRSSTRWAHYILDLLAGYKDFFQDAYIIGSEKINYAEKHNSLVPFQYMSRLMNIPLSKLAMVEDTSKNLKIPQQVGMKTVFITNGKDIQSDYAQISFEKPCQVIEAINKNAYPFS